MGFGYGAIPWSSIIDYARAFEIDVDDVGDFIYLMRAMDTAWMEWQMANSPKPDANPTAGK